VVTPKITSYTVTRYYLALTTTTSRLRHPASGLARKKADTDNDWLKQLKTFHYRGVLFRLKQNSFKSKLFLNCFISVSFRFADSFT